MICGLVVVCLPIGVVGWCWCLEFACELLFGFLDFAVCGVVLNLDCVGTSIWLLEAC